MKLAESFVTRVRNLQATVQVDPNNLAKLSTVSKLDGNPSWSLQAWFTCKGKAIGGEVSPVCQSCYALEGNYVYGNVIKPRVYNEKALYEEGFVEQMVQAIINKGSSYFRLFDSGDFPSVKAVSIWVEIMKRTPDVKYWVPTRTYKLERFQEVLKEMDSLPNVKVRFSSDSISGEFTEGLHGSTVIKYADENIIGVKNCEAILNDGKCNGCRACWNKEIPVIGYPSHGKRIKTTYKKIAIQAI